MNSRLALLWVLCGTLAVPSLASPASAQGMWDLPLGLWRAKATKKGRGLELRLEPLRRFSLVLHDTPRHERQIAGSYIVRVTKHNFQSATFTVQAIGTAVRKGGKTRLRRQLAATHVLGVEVRPAQALRITLVGGCVGRQDSLQLCLHGGRKGPPQTRCETLYRPRRRPCPPPIDGSLYNRPPSLAPNPPGPTR